MKRLIYILFAGVIFFIAPGCKQTELTTLVSDGVAPGPITNAVVENLSGAAKITYKLPPDQDLLYVKALYTSKQGAVRETKVSYYNNNLTVEGFGDTSAYEVKLYAVDRGENVSQPLSVTVKPKKAPFLIVRDSVKVVSDFGGISVSFKNSTENNIAIVVLANDSLGNFTPINTNYTNLKQSSFSVRDLKSVDTKFGIYIRDRWGNMSDTLITTLKPLFEVKLDRTKMKGVSLPTDAPLGYSGAISYLFDGDLGNGGYYHTGDAAKMPQWFTYDMGVSVKLSRMTWFMRQGFYFNLHNPRKVEIWGSNNPSPDGSFNNWELIATHEQIKPSGLPNGQLSNADNEAAAAGETITFPLNVPKVRYIRFKTLRNWSDGTYVNFNEIYMWGAPE
ncbi:hypothetical protein CPT03_10870 [Pedobacter ginsengisoli]|uniref:F5/8 type C domain-containing protein n=1 Tax=Pedobacter ginsengisoli TaxID=363852 RepID=A0A2D1U5S8_9SPHI|nr:DUF5000 domain-containing lipoprotein [Pedobacter ginsengisoli]ATP56947.1 hypothetical protein CPT03_10870 [Pedobacter ginsengisoli]